MSNHINFLRYAGGWDQAVALAPDCGHRRYWRVVKDTKTAILVEDSHSLYRFLEIGGALRTYGFIAPQVYESDGPFALIEDFGTRSLRTLPQAEALARAIDTLRDLARCEGLTQTLALSPWEGSFLQRKRCDFVSEYLKGTQEEVKAFEEAWQEAEKALPPLPSCVFIHADFHPDNLMALPDGRVGLLDFQDALMGPAVYDFINLVQDARSDISDDLYAAMKTRYCTDMNKEDCAAFDAWCRVLAAQFHCRVLALFTRLGGSYATHIPRLERYIQKGLTYSELRPVARWFAAYAPFFPEGGGSARII